PAVEAPWEEVWSLEASGRVAPGEELDVRARQRALARALPAALPERERWAAALLALEGGIAQVEAGLAELELRLHQELASREEGDPGAEVERRLEQALARLGSRLSAPELEQARQRLARQALRERWGLPTLSLFAPEAETDSG
ncbi:MAG TPA: hypothetical protein PK413_09875, partial [Thermoanaerobaculia bacterium]|nr:hypothetical protein [Thermoanaerobaculia bacterium]